MLSRPLTAFSLGLSGSLRMQSRAERLRDVLGGSEFTPGLMVVTTSEEAPLVLAGGKA